MTISGVSSAAGVQAANANKSAKPENYYDRQIKQLKERIQEIRDNPEMDAEQKQMMIEQYQEQIKMLESQKQRQQAEEQQKEIKESVEKMEDSTQAVTQVQEQYAPSKAEGQQKAGATGLDSSVQQSLMQFDSSKENMHMLNQLRAKTEMELTYLNDRIQAEGFKSDIVKAVDLEAKIDRLTGQAIAQMSQGEKAVKETLEYKRPEYLKEDGIPDQEEDVASGSTGTGRMEPGQFMSREA